MKSFFILLFVSFMFIPSAIAHCGSCGVGDKEQKAASCSACSEGNSKECKMCMHEKGHKDKGNSHSTQPASDAPASKPSVPAKKTSPVKE